MAIHYVTNRNFTGKTVMRMARSIPKNKSVRDIQATVEKLHLERLSQWAIARTIGMSRMTVATNLIKALTPIGQSIQPRASRPILELDELW
jgi:biotin operon repressor